MSTYRIDRTGKPDSLGKILLAERFSRSDPYHIRGNLPFGRAGRIAVGATSWYYTDGERFTIEQRDARGGVVSSFGAPRSRRPVELPHVLTSRGRSLADVDSVLKSSLIRTLAWMPYPDSMAAYSDLKVDARRTVWAQVDSPSWEPGIWDLFDANGRYLGEVLVPAGLRVLDITRDAMLAYHSVPGGTNELHVYNLTRGRP